MPGEWFTCLPEGIACLDALIKMDLNSFSIFGAEVDDGGGVVRDANWVSVSFWNWSQFALAKLVKVSLGDDERGEVLVRRRMMGR